MKDKRQKAKGKRQKTKNKRQRQDMDIAEGTQG